MLKIGIIVGSFKPVTKGHDFLIKKAAEECDSVKLFVSTKDRKRKNEIVVHWNTMEKIWNEFIQKELPENVEIIFDKNPAGKMIDFLEACNKNINDHNIYCFYSDDNDNKIIDNTNIRIKLKNLYYNNRIVFASYNRNKNINVSATIARKHIEEDKFEEFSETLPEYIEDDEAQEIFDLLRNEMKCP
jgi:cytidyltransferase-like protein